MMMIGGAKRDLHRGSKARRLFRGVVARAVLLMASAGCQTSVYKVRRAETTLCAKRVVVVVESIPSLAINLLHEPLVRELAEQGVEARVVEGPVTSLTDPRVASALHEFTADALLQVDVTESVFVFGTYGNGTQIVYELSLYEYTDRRDLIEVWDAEAMTGRGRTEDRSLDDEGANALAEKLTAKIRQSQLLWPCAARE